MFNLGIVRDENGKVSSTRLVMFIFVGLFVHLTITGTSVDPVILSTINSVILLCLGSSAVRGTVKNIGGNRE